MQVMVYGSNAPHKKVWKVDEPRRESQPAKMLITDHNLQQAAINIITDTTQDRQMSSGPDQKL